MLERDGLIRQQKLKAIFSGGKEDGPPEINYENLDLERLRAKSILAQQVAP